MPTSRKITEQISRSSWIRRMFEEGARMKRELGEDEVLDFTLGNPVMEPPPRLQQVLREVVEDPCPGCHRYMPNPGFPDVREAVARHLSEVHGRQLGPDLVVMTVGAAGAMNCVLKAILDPGDEVLVLLPFFPEYAFYVDNHGGRVVEVETDADFRLDLEAVHAALSERTRALIINSPNNPTGRVYDKASLAALGEVLRMAEARHGRPIYLIADEPYRALVYGGLEVPSVFTCHSHSVVCSSHSKDLAVPGERIGFAAINPDNPGAAQLFGAMAFTNRILGFVNAPALMQRVVARLQGVQIDPEVYRGLRDLLVEGLNSVGMQIEPSDGAFYVFPRTPISDDLAFANMLKEQGVLVVPGAGFGRSGHIRISYCVHEETIEKSLPRFARVMEAFGASGR